ncbi:hypothetical protein [Labrys sp. 22185]|uniref:hypothetical protein n=1 Tax=Labrys sp. 22185 TaxID=3453888 RepID=UPI003F846157
MAHPLLADAVNRFVQTLSEFESNAADDQVTDTGALWSLLEQGRQDLRSALQACDAMHEEAERLRRADAEAIRDLLGFESPAGQQSILELVQLLGQSAFTDDALCKLVAIQADQHASRPNGPPCLHVVDDGEAPI